MLVVDLDGTLTPSDTLVESLLRVLRHQPAALPPLLGALRHGRAHFKSAVAAHGTLAPDSLPWRAEFIDYLRAEHARGRRIVLATAAHESIAQAVAQHLGLFDAVLSTRDGHNLKGEAKLVAIRDALGPDFVYAGDARADIPVWNGGRAAILVGPARRLRAALTVPVEREFGDGGSSAGHWLRALRMHQWIKNTLVFVPLLTAFAFRDGAALAAAAGMFVAFCLAASATYMVNDVLDVDSDRRHPRKRQRPFASGALSPLQGLAAAVLLALLALGTAAAVSPRAAGLLAGYVVLTTLYSTVIKQRVLLDVIALAGLYTWRVLSGAVAISVKISPWLLVFSIFIFFSLALVKRCSELVALQRAEGSAAHGRDYGVQDLPVLWPLGVGAGLCSVVVMGMFIGSLAAAGQYASPNLLWLVGLALLYWISRLWIKTVRGQMHDDPVVFALKDRASRGVVLAMIAITTAARYGNW